MEEMNYSESFRANAAAQPTVNPLLEFQVVVLAGGVGSRLSPIIEPSCPSQKPLCKAMLPVANNPMIWYCLKGLHEATFGDIIVVTQENQQEELSEYLQKEFKNSFKRLEVIGLSNQSLGEEEDEWVKRSRESSDSDIYQDDKGYRACGTAETLLQIKDLLTTDVIVVSCDIIGQIDYVKLANRHRTENAACTMYLLEKNMLDAVSDASKNAPKKGKQATKAQSSYENRGNPVCAVLDADCTHVLAIQDRHSISHGEVLTIPKLHMFYCPSLTIKPNLYDAHVYIFKLAALKLFDNAQLRSMLCSIRFDLVPYMTTMQLSPVASEWSSSRLDCDIYGELLEKLQNDDSDQFENTTIDHMSSDGSNFTRIYTAANPPKKPTRGNRVTCCIHTEDAGFCCRVNNIIDYHEANLLFCCPKGDDFWSTVPEWLNHQPVSRKLGNRDNIVAENVTLESNVVMKSVVGADSTIQQGAKVTRSVLMDAVEIGENSIIQKCLIGKSVKVGSSCKLVNCIIRSGYTVPDNTVAQDETLPSFA